MATAIIGARIDYCNSLLYGTTERNLNRLQKYRMRRLASCIRLPSRRAPRLCANSRTGYRSYNQTTDHVQAGDTYFEGEVLSDPTISSRTASRPPGFQGTSIYYRSTALSTICVHRIRRAFYYSAPQVWNCLGTSTRSANTFRPFVRKINSSSSSSSSVVLGVA